MDKENTPAAGFSLNNLNLREHSHGASMQVKNGFSSYKRRKLYPAISTRGANPVISRLAQKSPTGQMVADNFHLYRDDLLPSMFLVKRYPADILEWD